MKKIILFLILITAVNTQARKYERRNFKLAKGQRFSDSLPEGEKGKWETRIIDRSMIKFLVRKRTAKKLEIVLLMLRTGMARMEAVLIKNNRVVKYVYYFFKIRKAVKKKIDNKIDKKKDPDSVKKKKETHDTRDFQFAVRLFDLGYYQDAGRAFMLFIKKHQKSPLVAEAYLYQGRASYEIKKYPGAIKLFKTALKSASGKVKYLVHLWTGFANLALGRNVATIDAFLSALTGLQFPDIDIRARTGLAMYYAKKGRYKMARKQFGFLKRYKKKGTSYILALYYAARFYDSYPVVRDMDYAYRYYRKFIQLSYPVIRRKKQASRILVRLKRYLKLARKRAVFIKKNFIDYR